MLGHSYTAALRKSGKQNIPACLNISSEDGRRGQPASVDFGDLLTTRSFHAAGDTPM